MGKRLKLYQIICFERGCTVTWMVFRLKKIQAACICVTERERGARTGLVLKVNTVKSQSLNKV